MDLRSLKMAIIILAEKRDSHEYSDILRFTAKLFRTPAETLDQLVRCHLADLDDNPDSRRDDLSADGA